MDKTGLLIKRIFGKIERHLPLFNVGNNTQIAYVDLLADNQLLNYFANEIEAEISEESFRTGVHRVVLLTAANKGAALAHLVGAKLQSYAHIFKCDVVVARKEKKIFYGNCIEVEKKSITSDKVEKLYITEDDAEKLRNRVVYIVDDVYTTGASIDALREAAHKCNTEVPADGGIYVALWEREKGATQPENFVYIDTLDLYHYADASSNVTSDASKDA